jgi:protein CpxP
MNRFRLFAAGAVIAGLLTTATGTFAQGPRRGGPGAGFALGGPELGLPLRDLNLSDAQQQQIKDVRKRHRDEQRQIAERMRTAMEAQRKAVETVPVNDSVIRAAAQDVAEVQADAAVATAHVRAEVLSLLTPEQQAQLAKLQADRQARAQQFRQRANRRQP